MTRSLTLLALVGLLNGCVVDRSGTRLDGGDAGARMDGGSVPEAGQIDAGTDGAAPDGSAPDDGGAPDGSAPDDGGGPDGGCGAVGDTRCAGDGSAEETCGSDGQWTTTSACNHGCDAGACLSACDGDDVTTLTLDEPVTVNLCDETDDFSYEVTPPHCPADTATHNDRLFRVEVPDAAQYCVFTSPSSSATPLLSWRTVCDDPATQQACFSNNLGGAAAQVVFTDAMGTSYVILDSFSDACDTVTVTFRKCGRG